MQDLNIEKHSCLSKYLAWCLNFLDSISYDLFIHGSSCRYLKRTIQIINSFYSIEFLHCLQSRDLKAFIYKYGIALSSLARILSKALKKLYMGFKYSTCFSFHLFWVIFSLNCYNFVRFLNL
ncbi:hypothetical protein H311_00753 [Anncaliia algerae PRA109]|nr:hypothetical protein H311_00753 [Anncaliia algerae PRA109]